MRVGVLLSLPVILLLQYDVALASGSYQCCLIDKSGTRLVYQGRASSRFKGTMDDLCKSVAREKAAMRCSGAAIVQVSFDFVKGRDGFDPDEQPDKANLFARCEATSCAIGLNVRTSDNVSVRPLGSARCNLAAFPAPKDGSGRASFTLRAMLPSGQANACVIDISGKTTTFFNDETVDK